MRDLSTNREKKEKIFKGKVAERLWNDFNLFINPKWLIDSLESILERAYYMHRVRGINSAAAKIQKNWKIFVFFKGQQRIKRKREAAARKIQRMWGRFVEEKVVPKRLGEKKTKAAILIQKSFRGYLERMKYSVMLGRKRIKENLSYFEGVWDGIVEESVVVIQRFYRKYLGRKQKAVASKKKGGNRFVKAVKAVRKVQRKK